MIPVKTLIRPSGREPASCVKKGLSKATIQRVYGHTRRRAGRNRPAAKSDYPRNDDYASSPCPDKRFAQHRFGRPVSSSRVCGGLHRRQLPGPHGTRAEHCAHAWSAPALPDR